METNTKQCKICFNFITSSQSVIVDKILTEIFDVLFIKLDLTSSPTVICCDCREKIMEVFLFKCKCVETEDTIAPYLFKNKIKSMKVLADKIRVKESTCLDDIDLCRLCKNIVFGNLTSLQTMLKFNGMTNFFKECIPEINLQVIENSIICGRCQQYITNFYNLLSVISEQEITNKLNNNISIDLKDNQHGTEEEINSSIKKYTRKCEKCLFQTNEWREFKKHMRKEHSEQIGNSLYKCSKCSYQASHKSRYVRHCLSHNRNNNINTFKCNLCSYVTFRKDALKEHMLVHDNKGQHKCSHCELMFKTKKSLRRHIFCKHDNEYVKAKAFKCHQCDYSTLRKDCLSRHMLRHENYKDLTDFYCYQCKYKSKFKSSLANHMMVHDSEESKTYVCKQCDYKTNRKATFNKHMYIHKTYNVNEIIKCNDCTYESWFKWELTQHIKRVHLPSKRNSLTKYKYKKK